MDNMNSNYFSDNNNNSDIISNKKDQKYNQQYLQNLCVKL